MTVTEAAQALKTSTQTIRNFLGNGTLTGRRGPKKWWLIDRESVDALLRERGHLNGGRRRRSALAILTAEVERLRTEVDRLSNLAGATSSTEGDAARERDELRARVVTLEDNIAQMRDAAELQRRAEAERANVVDQLLNAVAAAERADGLRREAVETLEAALSRSILPGKLE
jgi:excisionase family DNA binding protein